LKDDSKQRTAPENRRPMRIWVDADACPRAIKEILYRAAERVRVRLMLVANRPLRTPRSKYVDAMTVPMGFDVADGRILELVKPGDLVVTGDIPLAAEVVRKGAHALSPRGELYTDENVRERLAFRNLMDQLRSVGIDTGGPQALGQADRQAFANQLDRLLTRLTSR
jgi:uncharacterized protein YaiI (UPF0178 family)